MAEKITLTAGQRKRLEDLWFVYGNGGEKHTVPGHRFIQVLLEQGQDARGLYGPGAELIAEVDRILKG